MAKFYKLTNAKGWTREEYTNAMYWEAGRVNRATGDNIELCTDGVLHFYRSPEMAVIFNPAHAGIDNPRLWEVEGEEVIGDPTKGGARELTVIRELELPEIPMGARVRFAIYCNQVVCSEPEWNKWAEGWLSGKDRDLERAMDVAEIDSDFYLSHYAALAASYYERECVEKAEYVISYYTAEAVVFAVGAMAENTEIQMSVSEQGDVLQKLLLKAIKDEAEFEANQFELKGE